jgi:hypothetical protein
VPSWITLRSLFLAGLCLLLILVSACSSGKRKLYPVRGSVLLDGKPAEGAAVALHALDASDPMKEFPQGLVKADGSFALGTYVPGDGAPAGEYKVILSWVPEDGPLLPNGRFFNKLPDRYSDWKTTR